MKAKNKNNPIGFSVKVFFKQINHEKRKFKKYK